MSDITLKFVTNFCLIAYLGSQEEIDVDDDKNGEVIKSIDDEINDEIDDLDNDQGKYKKKSTFYKIVKEY